MVIGILALKLVRSLYEHFAPEAAVSKVLMSHTTAMGNSIFIVSIFFVPMRNSGLFNVPRRHPVGEKYELQKPL